MAQNFGIGGCTFVCIKKRKQKWKTVDSRGCGPEKLFGYLMEKKAPKMKKGSRGISYFDNLDKYCASQSSYFVLPATKPLG